MPRDQFACSYRLRVRWAEVDMQRVVFNGHYLTYIDSAVGEHWRLLGLDYPDGYVQKHGCDVFLRKSTVEYLESARYDDVLDVLVRVTRLGHSSMTYGFEIHRVEPEPSKSPLLTAELVYVNVELATMKPVSLPTDMRARIEKLERTAPAQSGTLLVQLAAEAMDDDSTASARRHDEALNAEAFQGAVPGSRRGK
jgi:YbgC/YbaW family acyl-CoA thioester hydrolase